MTTRGRAVTATVTYFAARKPDGVIGRAEYERHDPTTTWDDGGIAESNVHEDYASLVDQITQIVKEFRDQQAAEMRAYGAAQVQEAVVDYICESDLELAVHDGHLVLSLDASAGDIELRPWWYLEDLLKEALDGGEEVERALRSLSNRLMPEVTAAASPSRHRLRAPEPEPDPPAPRRRASAPPPAPKGRRRRASQ